MRRHSRRLMAWVIGGTMGIANAAVDPAVPPTLLPDAPERAWVASYCTKCHETTWIAQSGGSETAWATRIRRMVRRGAEIPAERIGPLARYLAAALPPRVIASAVANSPVNITVSLVEVRPLQVWVRTSGRAGVQANRVFAVVDGNQAPSIRAGQRVRAFQLRSRASMQQGQVLAVSVRGKGASVEVALRSSGDPDHQYLLEIIADLGARLTIPNEAVIEEGDRQLVYVRSPGGDFLPREVRTGTRGELYVEILQGLRAGEEVVTFGSFFIDAELRMKGMAGS